MRGGEKAAQGAHLVDQEKSNQASEERNQENVQVLGHAPKMGRRIFFPRGGRRGPA
jgi:topoisomerase IA-like protein